MREILEPLLEQPYRVTVRTGAGGQGRLPLLTAARLFEPCRGRAVEGDGRWIAEAWLERALALPKSQVGEIDNACLVCKHGQTDPQKLPLMRLISTAAWQKLHSHFGGSPELKDSGCLECVGHQSQLTQQRADLQNAMSNALLPADTGGGGRFGSDEPLFYVPKTLDKRWPKLLEQGMRDVTSELVCEHGGIWSVEDTRVLDGVPPPPIGSQTSENACRSEGRWLGGYMPL